MKGSYLYWEEKNFLIPIFAFALLFVPFCNKAFHIDDFAFISLSSHIDWNPLVAFSSESMYQGQLLTGALPYESTHPLLVPYLLKILIAVFGKNEIALHLAFMIFPGLALYALLSLVRTLFKTTVSQRTSLFVLFASLPAFLVNAHNLMTDVPFLSFLLLAISSYVKAVKKDSIRNYYLSSLSFCLAVFIAYQTFFFIPAVFCFAWANKKLNRHSIFSLVIPGMVLLAWLLLIYQRYDIFPILKEQAKLGTISSELGYSFKFISDKIIFILSMIGASCLIPLILNCFTRKTLLRQSFFILLFSVPVFFVLRFMAGVHIDDGLLLSLLVVAGIFTFSTVTKHCLFDIRESQAPGRGLMFLCWIATVLIYNLLIMPFGSARYLLPIFPPLFMVLLTNVSWRQLRDKLVLSGTIFLSLGVGLSTAVADFNFADSYRTMSEEVITFRQSTNNTVNVWYIGEWGMRHYMDKAGAKYLLADSNEPKRGDLVIIPEMPRFWSPNLILQRRLTPYGTREFKSAFPVRLFNRRSNAGFYCHFWGLLPYALSSEPDEVFSILRVIR